MLERPLLYRNLDETETKISLEVNLLSFNKKNNRKIGIILSNKHKNEFKVLRKINKMKWETFLNFSMK